MDFSEIDPSPSLRSPYAQAGRWATEKQFLKLMLVITRFWQRPA
jgi:hypothetical protein